ncbi:MAG TPA: RNase adapter RapZ [Candidatus Hydrogenedentes bacterium]|nr:RNase adapter RapZ [Candidatus Hydrogenedentota bacterium]HQM49602.1 RNase adapter RapZ [Candidatus Hydrogenedentota bacterium]
MPSGRRFVLVTGLSGAGLSLALRFLEDVGYYCVDNLPASLLPTFAELVQGSTESTRRKVAVCLDARAGEGLSRLPGYVQEIEEMGIPVETLFLDSTDEVLIHRYSETRRRHPCSPAGSVEEGIQRERELMAPMRSRADLVIDTSSTSVAELRERIASMFVGPREARGLVITVMSFGFKKGVPPEADLVFDVRFLPNPHYDPELGPKTGCEPDVHDFVLANPDGREFLDRLKGLLKFLIPRYAAEPKSYLTIGVGCTGGQHRSVAVAHAILVMLREMNYDARLRHRELPG